MKQSETVSRQVLHVSKLSPNPPPMHASQTMIAGAAACSVWGGIRGAVPGLPGGDGSLEHDAATFSAPPIFFFRALPTRAKLKPKQPTQHAMGKFPIQCLSVEADISSRQSPLGCQVINHQQTNRNVAATPRLQARRHFRTLPLPRLPLTTSLVSQVGRHFVR